MAAEPDRDIKPASVRDTDATRPHTDGCYCERCIGSTPRQRMRRREHES